MKEKTKELYARMFSMYKVVYRLIWDMHCWQLTFVYTGVKLVFMTRTHTQPILHCFTVQDSMKCLFIQSQFDDLQNNFLFIKMKLPGFLLAVAIFSQNHLLRCWSVFVSCFCFVCFRLWIGLSLIDQLLNGNKRKKTTMWIYWHCPRDIDRSCVYRNEKSRNNE